MVMAAKPKGFKPAAGAWGRGRTQVMLGEVEAGALRDLIAEAYRLAAPKRLIAALSGEATPAAKKKSAVKRQRA
jgi:hypothetical protein